MYGVYAEDGEIYVTVSYLLGQERMECDFEVTKYFDKKDSETDILYHQILEKIEEAKKLEQAKLKEKLRLDEQKEKEERYKKYLELKQEFEQDEIK